VNNNGCHRGCQFPDFSLEMLLASIRRPTQPEWSSRRIMRTSARKPIRGLPVNRIPPARSRRVR